MSHDTDRPTQTAPPELFPVVQIRIDDAGVFVDGRRLDPHVIAVADGSPHAAAVHTIARDHAARLGRPVHALATDATGRNRLVVHPDGTATDIAAVDDDEADDLLLGAQRAALRHQQEGFDPASLGGPLGDGYGWFATPAPATTHEPSAEHPATQDLPSPGGRRRADRPTDTPQSHAGEARPGSVPGVPHPGTGAGVGGGHRKSFIANEPAIEPARIGWRGALTRMGMRTKPSRAELAFRDDVRQVSQHWPGPRTIAIANPKGSANKTPTMVCLSSIFGRHGGAGVLGWDNNETRGTAAWRTRQGPHQATVLDLLPYWQDLLGAGAQAAQLAHYVHHQPADKFDVLWSDQSTASEHEMTGEEVRQVHEVAAKYYRLIFMDSGNSERASNWRAMIAAADQLVVPCTNVEDTAEAGARMLEALAERDEHSAHLARNAVAVVSQRTPGKDPNMARIVDDFAPLVRTVVSIPHDPGLYSGVINFDALARETQRAWLAAGAAVSRGF